MLEDLKSNIVRLISLYEGEKQRADMLAGKLAESEAVVLSCKMQITDLNQQIDNLKLSCAFTGSGDNTVAKQRVDNLIKEIDKCIALLEN